MSLGLICAGFHCNPLSSTAGSPIVDIRRATQACWIANAWSG